MRCKQSSPGPGLGIFMESLEKYLRPCKDLAKVCKTFDKSKRSSLECDKIEVESLYFRRKYENNRSLVWR